MSELTKFLERVEGFLTRSGMSERAFGKAACNDTMFVSDLRAGREPRFSTIEKVDAFMSSQDEASGRATPGADDIPSRAICSG